MGGERNQTGRCVPARAWPRLWAWRWRLAGCGSTAIVFSSSALDLFSTSSKATPAMPAAGAPIRTPTFECPGIEVRTGAATLMIGSKPGEGEPAALDLRYQGTIIRTARECQVTCRRHDHEGRRRGPRHHRSGRRTRHGRRAAAACGGAGRRQPEDHRVEIRARAGDDCERGRSRHLHPYRTGDLIPDAAAARISTPMWSMSASIRWGRSRKRKNRRRNRSLALPPKPRQS